MERDLISIVVPVYNVEAYIEKCILSIINQTHKNLQIVLVDDGSTDRSGQICDFYGKVDERIQVIHQNNGGLVCARKRGLECVKGEYVGFVDGDDYIDENMYADMLEDMLKFQADFVHTGFFTEKKDSVRKRLGFESKLYHIRDKREPFLRDYIIDDFQIGSMTYSIWSKLFKRDLILKCYQKVPDTQAYGEDLLALCACILEGNSVYMKSKAYYHYVDRKDSMTNSNWVEIEEELGKLYKCLQDLLKSYNAYSNLKNCIDKWYQIHIIENVFSNRLVHFCIHRYFFPDSFSLENKKIVLYGAGAVGQDYYAQLCQYRMCKIVAWVDKNAFPYDSQYMDIVKPQELKHFDYDLIIIAVNSRNMAEQIKRELIEIDISKEKIVWVRPQYFYK